MDLITLLVPARIDKANPLIKRYKQGTLPINISDKEWQAIAEFYHTPNTGERIPAFLRSIHLYVNKYPHSDRNTAGLKVNQTYRVG